MWVLFLERPQLAQVAAAVARVLLFNRSEAVEQGALAIDDFRERVIDVGQLVGRDVLDVVVAVVDAPLGEVADDLRLRSGERGWYEEAGKNEEAKHPRSTPRINKSFLVHEAKAIQVPGRSQIDFSVHDGRRGIDVLF